MRKLLLFLILPYILFSCSGEESKETYEEELDKKRVGNKIIPQTNIRANKTYDENGQMQRYDSVYVWSYTDPPVDSTDVSIDLVRAALKLFLESQMDPNPFQDHCLRQGSFFNHYFLNQDYFIDRWDQQLREMRRVYLRWIQSSPFSFGIISLD